MPSVADNLMDGFCCAAGAYVEVAGQLIVNRPLGASLAHEVARAFDSFGLNYNLQGRDDSWVKVNDETSYRAWVHSMPWPQDPVLTRLPASAMGPDAWG